MSEPNTFDPNASTDELVSFALSHLDSEGDVDPYWEAVCELHKRGTREVFEAATRLLVSDCPSERTLGADIHGQIGVSIGHYDKPFAAESARLLAALLELEDDEDVIHAALIALGHLHKEACIPAVVRFANHPDSIIRYSVTHAMAGLDDERAIVTLITLTTDADEVVRDWATFALGTQTDWDGPELRAALWARLSDSDNIVRGEALKGLARRRDERAVEATIEELRGPDPHEYAVEAAGELADPRLVPALEALRLRWAESAWLESVIEECRAGRGSQQ